MKRRAWARIGVAGTAGLAALLLLPLVVVVSSAFVPLDALGVTREQWAASAGASSHFAEVLGVFGGHLETSAALALAVGALVLGLGAPAGVGFALAERSPEERRLSHAIEVALTLPLSVPGLVVAMALLVSYPGRGGELGLLVVGHALYTLPYVVRGVAGEARATGLGPLLEAARSLGASRAQRALRVAWPCLRRSLATSLLVSLTVSWGELNVTFLLATPARGTFPTALYLAYTNYSFPVAAAATTIFLAGLAPLLVLASLVSAGRATPEQAA